MVSIGKRLIEYKSLEEYRELIDMLSNENFKWNSGSELNTYYYPKILINTGLLINKVEVGVVMIVNINSINIQEYRYISFKDYKFLWNLIHH